MLKIKDVADRLHISPRAIRFYEAKGLISPQKLPDNQYRSFSEKDVWRLQTIVSLREIGMSVGDIRNVLRKIDEGDSDKVREYLELQRALLFAQLTVEWVAPREGEEGLDIGTGTGSLTGRFLARGIRMAGIDQSREMLRQCRRKYPSLETKLGNFLAIPYVDGRFDFVVTSFAFHHLTDEQKRLALEEMRRVLKPSGRICIADLMFADERERQEYLARLREGGMGGHPGH